MNKSNLELIRQALGAAESSIRLAKQLLNDLEGSGVAAKPKAIELPGVAGVFDGENMVSENGQSFPVPANYASKSMLVVGDSLKLVDEGKEKRFKQIEHVKRHKTTGILTKKDGKWKAVTPEGSYKVLPAAVAHFGADVGSEVTLHLPANNLTVPYGAIESVKSTSKETTDSKEEPKTLVATETKTEVEKPVVEKAETAKTEPKEKKEELKQEVKKVEEKKVETPKPEAPKPAPKVEAPKVETPKPAPKVEKPVEVKEEVKAPAKETVVIKPEPLKAITIEPEPKVEAAPKPAAVSTAAKPAPIEVTPEEDELT